MRTTPPQKSWRRPSRPRYSWLRAISWRSFRRGLDTVIGEEGLSLSGGQRQRLSLARALAKRPSVLLLDDPFSALDVNTEERIITGLREGLEGLGGATTLLTAHRPSTVALADRVLLMVDGAVVAEGTHAELMDSSEQYRQLMTMEEG